jgi:hypothetical protein
MANSFYYIVQIDRVRYSKSAKSINELVGVDGLSLLNQKTQECIDVGLSSVGLSRQESVLSTRGDDAIILFKTASLAHDFASSVHNYTNTINIGKHSDSQCWFRIGCAYGEIKGEVLSESSQLISDPASWGLAVAARLHVAAKPGEFLVDPSTYESLNHTQKQLYGYEENVSGKVHDELLPCHRYTIISGLNIANFIKSQKSENMSISINKENSQDIIDELFRKLKDPDEQISTLIRRLKIPKENRPSDKLTPSARQNKIINWMEDEEERLIQELQRLVKEQNPQ